MQRDQALDFLARLGGQPAVAFYEDGVASVITAILSEAQLPFRIDEFGNVIVRIPGQRPDVSPLALMAHMDHPGFEAVDVQGDCLVGVALGGVPPSSFDAGVLLSVRAAGWGAAARADGRASWGRERPTSIDRIGKVTRIGTTSSGCVRPAGLSDYRRLPADARRRRPGGLRQHPGHVGCLEGPSCRRGRLWRLHPRRGSGPYRGPAAGGGWDPATGNPGSVGRVQPCAAGGRAGSRAGDTGRRRGLHFRRRCRGRCWCGPERPFYSAKAGSRHSAS